MFCVQCEQTIRTPAGNGCSYAQGMCGKTAETSDLQDLLIAALQGLSAWAVKAREYGIINHDVDSFAPRAFFSTLTNVNFDSPRIVGYAREAIALREALLFTQKTAYAMTSSLVGSEMCIRDSAKTVRRS
ncbi:hypothetical protein ACX3VG_08810, partial [Escherichia coli]